MLLSILLPCQSELELTDSTVFENTVSLKVKTSSLTAECPDCHSPSSRVHSLYFRTLHDLPLANFCLQLNIQVRRFFCTNPACSRKIFAERLTGLAKVYAHRTLRQTEELYQFGLELGGEAAARLAKKCNNPISGDTILRIVRLKTLPKRETPQIVGVDDFAFKKGHSYGTLIIDLINHRPLDLLPDRTATTLADWLRLHPGIAVITRDRAGAYADGIKQGAPAALQVADHFHLLLNLTKHAKEFLEGNKNWQKQLEPEKALANLPTCAEIESKKPAEEEIAAVEAVPTSLVTASTSKRLTAHHKRQEERSRLRRDRRLERYKQVVKFHQQGLSPTAIAREVKLDFRTVTRYLKAGQFPELASKAPRKGALTPYKDYLKERWSAGQPQVNNLVAELRTRGYKGGSTIVYDYVRKTLKGCPEGELSRTEIQKAKNPEFSARQGAWLLVADPEKLKKEAPDRLIKLLETGEPYTKFYELAQRFRIMLKEKEIKEWGSWLAEAKGSGIVELQSFANGLERDEKAVKNAIISDLSNGQTEGQVNRLKVIKRQMYGRAGLDLLKARVVGRAA